MRSAGSVSAAARTSPIGRAATTAPPACRFAWSRNEFKPNAHPAPVDQAQCAILMPPPASPGRPTSSSSCSIAISPARHPTGGMTGMDELDYRRHGRADAGRRRYIIEYREPPTSGWAAGPADRRLPDRSPGRRPVDDLQLLRPRPADRPGPRHLSHPRPYPPRRARPGCPMSISAIGSRARGGWPTRPASARSSGSGAAAGHGSSPKRQTPPPDSLPSTYQARVEQDPSRQELIALVQAATVLFWLMSGRIKVNDL